MAMTRRALGGEGRVERPARIDTVAARRARNEQRSEHEHEGSGQQPERDIVHARKGHVRRADHQWHHPVAEASNHRRHDCEENHEEAVGTDEHIVDIRATEDLHARIHELRAHAHGQQATDHPADDSEDQIHRAYIFVVGGKDPPPPSVRAITVDGFRLCAICHDQCPYLQSRGYRSRVEKQMLQPRETSAAAVF